MFTDYFFHNFRSIQENPNSWNFTESLNPKQASAVNEAESITTLKTINADDIIEHPPTIFLT